MEDIHPVGITDIFPELPPYMQNRDLYGVLYPGDEMFTKSDILYVRWKQVC